MFLFISKQNHVSRYTQTPFSNHTGMFYAQNPDPYHTLWLILSFEVFFLLVHLNFHVFKSQVATQLEVNLGSILCHFDWIQLRVSLSVNHGSSQSIEAFIICWTSFKDILSRQFCSASSKHSIINWSTREGKKDSKTIKNQSILINILWSDFGIVVSHPRLPNDFKLKTFPLPTWFASLKEGEQMCELMFLSVLGFIIVQFACLSLYTS